MSNRHIAVALLVWVSIAGLAQPVGRLPGAAQSQPAASPQDPVLTHRPPPSPASKVAPAGRIQLDVVVTDAAGVAVNGLEPWDFKLLQDDQPRKILSFHSYGGSVKPDPPVEVILLLDTANQSFQQVAFARTEIARFLGENGGHLAHPTTIILLTDAGIRIQPRPSMDGNALVSVLEQVKGQVGSINPAMGAEGALERLQLSVHQLTAIAENEAKRPGRKLLIWVGPGWPILNGEAFRFSEKDQARYFDAIVQLSTRLREARLVLYSVAASTGTESRTTLYQAFLKGVKSARQADTGNLALKVLVTQSGGRILGPDNDVAGQIDRCIGDADRFYRLTFDPSPAEHADEFHELKLLVDKPGLTARTNTGYYNQP